MKRVFLRLSDGLEIVDVSGKKSINDVKDAFGDGQYEIKDVEEGKMYTIKNGTIEDYVNTETDEEKKEKLIKAEMESILRAQAVEKLKGEGKI